TELFTDESINTEDAQLLFTTHNSKIMDVLGKYRTILVNKEENESYLYRLDELPGDLIRNDRPIEPIYRSGKVGGVPKV
ncbi:MAG: ATP-binding protein, partial [Spirochaetota bacterium]|nr:ATP-binding protein [Spirochaetota bacterium]